MSEGGSLRFRVVGAAFSLLCCSLLITSYSAKNRSFGRLGVVVIGEAISPLQNLVYGVTTSTQSSWSRYISLLNVQGENETLLSRLEQLEGDLALLHEFQGENERLRRLLDFSRGVGLHGVVGSVIGFDPSGWVRGIVVNKGSSSGVLPGLAVIHARGVVGQVVAVGPSTARVLLLSDHSSGVDAVVQGSRARGIVEGSGGSMCELRYVNREHSVKPGELVLTSGMDGVFPKGLVIGSVTDIDAAAGGLFQSIALKPSVDFSRLEEVLILTFLQDTLDPDVSGKNLNQKNSGVAIPTRRPDGAGVRRPRPRGEE